MDFLRKLGDKDVEDEVITDPVKEGDIVYFVPESHDFYFHGDGSTGRAGFQSTDHGEPENFGDCLWRIIPKLSYTKNKEYEMFKSHGMSNDPEAQQHELLLSKEMKEEEDKANAGIISKVVLGHGAYVTYGQNIHLMHLQTGKFLMGHKSTALLEKDALKLTLESKVSKSACFSMQPSIKVRSLGGQVYYGDSIDLSSVKVTDYKLHCSPSPFSLSDPLPRVHEASMSHTSDPLKVQLFARFTEASLARLRVGLPVRLYHHEAESFLQASSNRDKHLKTLSEKHLPYLKRTSEGDYGGVGNFSGKAVWMLENISRERGGEIKWNSNVRVRHMPSGKYLAVDYRLPKPAKGHGIDGVDETKEDHPQAAEVRFDAILVAEKEMQKLQIDFVQTVFVIRKVGDQGEFVDLRSNLQLEHQFSSIGAKLGKLANKAMKAVDERKVLYLSWTKEKKGNNKQLSSTIAFIAEKKDHDALQIVQIEEESVSAMVKMLGFRDVADKYVLRLKSREKIVHADQLIAEYAMLKELIFQIIIGDQAEDDKPETIWGPSERFQQLFARDCKLMDSLMRIVQEPVTQKMKMNFNSETKIFEDRRFGALASIHRLTCKALSHLFFDNAENEEYFARQSFQDISWFDILIAQVAYPVGASEALTLLISNNAKLLNQYVQEDQIKLFEKMISEEGPRSEFLGFFTGICSCHGAQILSNQELMLQHIFERKKRKELVIEHKVIAMEHDKGRNQRQPFLTKVDSPKNDPGEYLGKNESCEGFPQVCIYWYSQSPWHPGNKYLFHAPEDLAIEPIIVESEDRKSVGAAMPGIFGTGNQTKLVPIQQLCWALDPARFKEKVTGEKYEPFEDKKDEDDDQKKKRVLFENTKQLASYLLAQIDLFAEMALDRSYNVIYQLRSEFPYAMLVSLVADNELPDQLRASYLKLLLRIWLDCYPQEENCGRHQFPDLIWIYDALKQTTVKESDALPRYYLPPDHPALDETDEMYTCNSANKFYLVEAFISNFFVELKGCQIIEDAPKSHFTLNVLNVLKKMISFGFYETYDDLKSVCGPMISTLDGREDRRHYPDEKKDNIMITEEPDERYKKEENTCLVMDCKQNICEALIKVVDLNANYCLKKILFKFRQFNESSGGKGLMPFKILENKDKEGPVEHFIELFDSDEDTNALDLQSLCDNPLDTILLDLLMYESDGLFDAALKLLVRRYTKKQSLLNYMKEVKLLDSHLLPIYDSFEKLDLEISILRNHMQSFEIWGLQSGASDSQNDVYDKVLNSLEKILSFMLIDEGSMEHKLTGSGESSALFMDENLATDTSVNLMNQKLLFCLGLHKVLFTAIDIGLDYPLDSDSRTHELVKSSVICMSVLMKNNLDIQDVTFGELPKFRELMKKEPSLGVSKMIIEIFRGNLVLSEHMVHNADLFDDFAAELSRTHDSKLLEFFSIVMLPMGETIPENQNRTILVLENEAISIDFSTVWESKKSLFTKSGKELELTVTSYISALLKTFIVSSKNHNTFTVGKLQKFFPIDSIITAVTKIMDSDVKMLNDSAAREFLQTIVEFLYSIFFDTAMEDTKYANDAALHALLLKLVKHLQEELIIDEEHRDDMELAYTVMNCIRHFIRATQSTTNQALASSTIFDDLTEQLIDILSDEGNDLQFRGIIHATLVEMKADERNAVVKRFGQHHGDYVGKSRSATVQFSNDESKMEGEEEGILHDIGTSQKNLSNKKSRRMQLDDKFQQYIEVISSSEDVKEKMEAEKMSLVDFLENVELLTDPDYEKTLESQKTGKKIRGRRHTDCIEQLPQHVQELMKREGKRTNKITFDDLVKRMCTFVQESIGNQQLEPTCFTVFEILEMHLIRAREKIEEEKKEKDADLRIILEAKARQGHIDKQIKLCQLGIADVVYEAICSDPDSDLSQKALDLGREMMMNGNTTVQESFVEYSKTHDANGLFFKNMKDRLQESAQEIKFARKLLKTRRDLYKPPTSSYEEAQDVFTFMQQLCEGHFEQMQHLLREQPFNRKSFNLVSEVTDFLGVLGKNPILIKEMEDAEMELMISALCCTIEIMQGPCPENQEFIAGSKAIGVCKLILYNSSFPKLENPELGYKAKTQALVLIASSLEGRTDLKVHKMLEQQLEPRLLDNVVKDLANDLKKFNSAKNALPRANNSITSSIREPSQKFDFSFGNILESKDSKEIERMIVEHVDTAAQFLFTIRKKMLSLPTLHLKLEEPSKHSDDKKLFRAYTELQNRLISVEIQWKGKVEVLLFPIPSGADSLTDTTKQDFLESVDLATHDTRLKGLMDKAPDMLEEMKILKELDAFSPYVFIKKHYKTFKYFNFYMAVLLNILTLVAVKGQTIYYPSTRTRAAQIAITVIALILCIGYLIVITFFMVSQYQLVWRAFRREFKDDKRIKYTRFKRLRKFIYIVIAYILICAMHAIGWAALHKTVVEGYFIFGFVVFGMAFFRELRQAIVIPKGFLMRLWASTYDVMTDPKIFSTILFLICTGLGFFKPYFFTFLLFDIISLSEHLKNTVRAVTKPIIALAMTAVLFVAVILVFATIGYDFYGHDDDIFCEDCPSCEGDDFTSPSTQLEAFWLVVNGGIRNGDIGAVMTDFTHFEDGYHGRIFFTLAFFIVVGVLLFDMVTGIILDTFGMLREETAQRNAILDNESFVSGVTRLMYDEHNLLFEKLKKKDQHIWNYVYFMLYLDTKDKSDFNGAENYVWNCLQNDDATWFPARTSFALEELSVKYEEEVTLEQHVEALKEEFRKIMGDHYEKFSLKLATLMKKKK